jgi:drug/metabolite transporter (DMT)-like permease
MAGALVCFSIMAVSLRGLAKVLNVFEMLSIRSGSGVLVLCALLAMRPQLRHLIVPRRMGLHALRNTVHFAAQVCWAQSVVLLPLATVFALEFTTPVWVALLAVSILREPLTAARSGTIVLGFIGVIVVLRPGFAAFQPAALLVLAAALGFGIALTATKALTETQSTFAILFWMNLMQLPMNLAGSDLLFLAKLSSEHILPAVGVAVSGVASHYCLTNAFRSGDAVFVVPLDFLRVPLIAFVGWWVYAEALDPFVFLGAGLIIAGIVWNLLAEARRSSRPAS